MTDAAQLFIESHLDDIDTDNWLKVFEDVYAYLDIDTSIEVFEALIEALDPDTCEKIDQARHSLFWKTFEEILAEIKADKINLNSILLRYENYYGMSQADARNVLFEEDGLNWTFMKGNYYLET